ncbi:hypothetical protein APHMUC_1209 [Anaplasma phagocytophilum str. ApMUC09]|uniref:Uncharacterized protein n=1 Tax=Anaplasma phagocytophilum str. ApMUC09 TaxID=1359152 RepID=A0A0F3N8R6_ANAPH|nr:hypothetical protein APHMUC_1209 [Anaplasma phagocytophilum str. ApMUC09]
MVYQRVFKTFPAGVLRLGKTVFRTSESVVTAGGFIFPIFVQYIACNHASTISASTICH